jgi:outer membrane protein OmpA-like peptidoglycan-associated protein/tetratricopeptide (TPR) repeat protein
MKKIARILLFLLIMVMLSVDSFAQVKKNIRKAENSLYKGDYEKSKGFYLQALKIENDNYKVNLGLGIVLNEYMENYEESLPYLENALKHIPGTDTVPDLILALAKAYHFMGRYDEALIYYKQMLKYNDPDDEMFQNEINKGIDDCNFAKENPQITPATQLYVVNVGPAINSSMQEYVPVLTSNSELLFTSKRQDESKEKINGDNGKYFESMYIAKINNGRTSIPIRYTFPDSKVNSNESIVSVLPSGNKIIIYKDRKLYEGDMAQENKKPSTISRIENFDAYQNHAFLCKGEQVLYFTTEADDGFGGDDIYKSIKQADGSWGQVENLSENINTVFDEEAPFLTGDGDTLYFASKGHLGYGGYDIYRSTLQEDGKWSLPVNLGQPINTPGDDLFIVIDAHKSVAYFSSSRKGGYGEMDIYKINFTDKISKECTKSIDSSITVNADKIVEKQYKLSVEIPEGMKDKIISTSIMINDSVITNEFKTVDYEFKDYGSYRLKAKVVAWCDTCINLFVACNEKLVEVTKPVLIPVADTTILATVDLSAVDLTTLDSTKIDLLIHKVSLTAVKSSNINFKLPAVYFDFNGTGLRDDAIEVLRKNIALLQKYPDLYLTLNGYTDSRGKAGFNKLLSEKRANDVKKYLVKNGIDRKRISTFGNGEAGLINDCGDNSNCDETMHQKNRRVEFKVYKK